MDWALYEMRVSTDASCPIQAPTNKSEIRSCGMRDDEAKYHREMETQKRTNRSLVSTFLHQTEELLCGTMVTILLIQLLYCCQQLVDDGLQLRTAYCL